MSLLYLIPGHGQRSPWRYDPGAYAGGLEEARSVRLLAAEVSRACEQMGLPCVVDGEGEYSERHERAFEVAWDTRGYVAVVHLHHDAGPDTVRRALAIHDHRSRGGEQLAGTLGAALLDVAGNPWGECRVVGAYDDRGQKGAWLHRAFGCIDEVYTGPRNISAALLEVGFVTHAPTRAWLLAGGYAAAGKAIARGAADWLAARGRRVA